MSAGFNFNESGCLGAPTQRGGWQKKMLLPRGWVLGFDRNWMFKITPTQKHLLLGGNLFPTEKDGLSQLSHGEKPHVLGHPAERRINSAPGKRASCTCMPLTLAQLDPVGVGVFCQNCLVLELQQIDPSVGNRFWSFETHLGRSAGSWSQRWHISCGSSLIGR